MGDYLKPEEICEDCPLIMPVAGNCFSCNSISSPASSRLDEISDKRIRLSERIQLYLKYFKDSTRAAGIAPSEQSLEELDSELTKLWEKFWRE